jgi:hypothetical protein
MSYNTAATTRVAGLRGAVGARVLCAGDKDFEDAPRIFNCRSRRDHGVLRNAWMRRMCGPRSATAGSTTWQSRYAAAGTASREPACPTTDWSSTWGDQRGVG